MKEGSRRNVDGDEARGGGGGGGGRRRGGGGGRRRRRRELGYLHETTTQGGLAGVLEMARGRGPGADGPTSGRMFDQKGAGRSTMSRRRRRRGWWAHDGCASDAESTQRTTSFSHTLLLPHDPRFSYPTLLRRRFELNGLRRVGPQDDAEAGVPPAELEVPRQRLSKRREKRMGDGRPRHRSPIPGRPPARLPVPFPHPPQRQDMERQMDESSKDRAMDQGRAPARPALVEIGARRPLRHQRDPPRRRRRRRRRRQGASAKKKAKKKGLAGASTLDEQHGRNSPWSNLPLTRRRHSGCGSSLPAPPSPPAPPPRGRRRAPIVGSDRFRSPTIERATGGGMARRGAPWRRPPPCWARRRPRAAGAAAGRRHAATPTATATRTSPARRRCHGLPPPPRRPLPLLRRRALLLLVVVVVKIVVARRADAAAAELAVAVAAGAAGGRSEGGGVVVVVGARGGGRRCRRSWWGPRRRARRRRRGWHRG